MSIDRSVIRPTAIGGARLSVDFVQKMLDLAPPGLPLVRSCITCEHFAEFACPASSIGPAHNDAFCRKFGMNPPARVIAYGCPQYENDDVPF